MKKHINTRINKNDVSTKKIDLLLKQIKDFQEVNQKYLIKTTTPVADVKPIIINMVNTNF